MRFDLRATLRFKRVVDQIDDAPNRVRYCMNGFVIAVGTYIKSPLRQAKSAAKKIGKVDVNVGETSCKVPLALEYIEKVETADQVGKKQKKQRNVRVVLRLFAPFESAQWALVSASAIYPLRMKHAVKGPIFGWGVVSQPAEVAQTAGLNRLFVGRTQRARSFLRHVSPGGLWINPHPSHMARVPGVVGSH